MWGGLLFVLALGLFFKLGAYGLVDADEGRYASIPLEMLRRGDWVTPMLNGVEFFDKPVFLYWSVMASYSVFGVSEFAARLPSALFVVAGIVAVYALNLRAFGSRAAFLGALVLSTTLTWPVLGRTVITDTPLASLFALSLCFWWLGHTETSSRRHLWFGLFWATLGLGVLTKGPVAVVLAFGAIIPYLLWCRPARGWSMGALWGVPLLLLVAAPWFIVVQARNPEFNHLFWYEQNIARFLGRAGEPDHWEKPYFFLPFLPVIFFPWSLWMPRAITRVKSVFQKARFDNDEKARAAVFLVLASLFVLLFFSASKSKIITYLAPMLPPACALMGTYLDALWRRGDKLRAEAGILAGFTLVLGIVAFAFAPRAAKTLGTNDVTVWVVVLGVVLFGWSAALWWGVRQRQMRWIVGATAGGAAVLLAVVVSLWSSMASTITTRSIVAQIRPAFTPDSEIASVGFIQSLSFYTGHRIAVDGVPGGADDKALSPIPDELRPGWNLMGQNERNEYFYGNHDGLKRYMSQRNPVFVVFRNSRLDQGWSDLGADAHVLATNKRYTVYGNHAAWLRFEQVEKHEKAF